MTLDAGPQCPYCWKRGTHYPDCNRPEPKETKR